MEQICYTIKLDMKDTGMLDTGIRLKQGDNNILLLIKITNNGKMAYYADDMPDIVFLRPDGNTVIAKCAVGNEAYAYVLKGNELEVPGKVRMDVKFPVNETGRTSTCTCSFECVPDTYGTNAGSAGVYYNDIETILANLDLMKDYATACSGSAEEAQRAAAAAAASAEEAENVAGVSVATTAKAGIVKPDGTTIEVAADGTIKAKPQSAMTVSDSFADESSDKPASARLTHVLNEDLNAVRGAMTANTTAISDHASKIAANTSAISASTGNINANAAAIAANTGNISANAAAIAANTGKINTNTTAIAKKVAKVNGVSPDANGNLNLTAQNVGAMPAGTEAHNMTYTAGAGTTSPHSSVGAALDDVLNRSSGLSPYKTTVEDCGEIDANTKMVRVCVNTGAVKGGDTLFTMAGIDDTKIYSMRGAAKRSNGQTASIPFVGSPSRACYNFEGGAFKLSTNLTDITSSNHIFEFAMPK